MKAPTLEKTTDSESLLESLVTPAQVAETGRPDPEWVRGKCPRCGDDLVSNLYYRGGKGYIIRWECWSSLGEMPTCEYRRVL